MKLKKIVDYILGRTTDNSPDYILGVKNGKAVKSIGGGVQLIGKLIGANMNTTADQIINLSGGTKFVVIDILVTNASINLTTAAELTFTSAPLQAGIYIADSLTLQPANTGGSFQNILDGLRKLTSPSKYINAIYPLNFNTNSLADNSFINIYNKQDVIGNKIYASLITPQGATATADIYIYGYVLG